MGTYIHFTDEQKERANSVGRVKIFSHFSLQALA